MKCAVRAAAMAVAGLGLAQLGGCPIGGLGGDVYPGTTGEQAQLRDRASVEVLTPASDLSITGGTPVEVNWLAFARSPFAILDVIIDVDQDPDNGNETRAYVNLALSVSSVLVDTTALARGAYYVGVVQRVVGEVVAFDYATGRVIIDQRPELFFTSNDARTNWIFDRTERVIATFEVAWEVFDPDSSKTVEIFLDPDDAPNGNEIRLFQAPPAPASDEVVTGSFTFDLPTAAFEPGTYRFLALVNDGRNAIPFYAPGSIRLRARLAGHIDLRNLGLPEAPVQGAVFQGFNPRDNAGSFMSTVRDVDNDGFSDFIIMAQFGKPQYSVNTSRTGVGEGYLIYGRAERFTGLYNLNSTGVLYRGEVYTGPPEAPDPIRPTRGVTSFATLSDWDGDGVRDFAFGIPFTDSLPVAYLDQAGYFRTGAVVIASSQSLLSFQGHQVLPLAGFGVEWVSGDSKEAPCPEGFEGPKAPTGSTGATYYYWHASGTVPANRLGCRFSTVEFGDQCGEKISAYPWFGGTPDVGASPDSTALVISVPGRDPYTCVFASGHVPGAGVVSAYYPPAGFFPWDLEDPLLPHHGPFLYVMDDLFWSPGYVVDPDDAEPCERWVSGDLPVPESTTRLYGGFAGAALGNAEVAEDFNGDGIADILIGSPLSNDGAGATFLVLGRLPALVIGAELAIEELGLPMNSSGTPRAFDGIRVVGAPGDRLGQAQSSAGDFNNDGIADVLIGSPFVNNRKGGAAVFFGSRTVINLTEDEIPFDEIPDRGLGVIFEGEEDGDLAGARVCGVGDVDGDGSDDILIAAPDRSVRIDLDLDGVIDIDRRQCGVVYLIYGGSEVRGRLRLADVGTEQVPGAVFIGARSGDHLGGGLGEQGDRSNGIATGGDINADGFDDILIGAVRASPRDRTRAGEAYLVYGAGD